MKTTTPELAYKAYQYNMGGKRFVQLTLETTLMPYVRQTQGSRYGTSKTSRRARDYNESRGDFRDALRLIMLKENIKPFPEKIKLGFKADFWLLRANGTDLGNMIKALEDCGNEVLYPDDKQIWEYGICRKQHGEPKVYFSVWET